MNAHKTPWNWASAALIALAVALGGCGSSGGSAPVTTTANADLASLAVSTGTLSPAFSSTVTTYFVGPGLLAADVTVTPTAADAGATITVDGTAVASGSPSSLIPLPLGSTVVTVAVTASDGVTVTTTTIDFTRTTLTAQEAYIKASNTDAGDKFGRAIGLSGDTLVVGAYEEHSSAAGVNGNEADNGLANSGAAYVFVRSGTTWTQQAYLKASSPSSQDVFGYSVAISGDTIVVGAYEEDSNASGVNGDDTDNSLGNSGAAYVFVRNGTTWTQQAYLKASTPDGGDRFGTSVRIDGDTIVVGAPFESSNAMGVNGNETDNSASQSGAAYIFVRSGTTWSQQAYLKASNPDTQDYFGESVSLSGDIVVVGAYGEDSCASGVNGNHADNSCGESGAAYVFVRSGTTWSQQAYLKASNTDAADIFGFSVAVSGDTVAIGAQEEQSSATGVNGNDADDSLIGAGAAYVFTRSGTTWSQQAYLKASNTDFADNFSFSIWADGDTLVVGSFSEDSNATGINGNELDNSLITAGAAYVFVRSGTTWTQQSYVKPSNPESLDRFAYSLALDGDTVVVSAYEEDSSATGIGGNQADNSAPGSGAVYVLR